MTTGQKHSDSLTERLEKLHRPLPPGLTTRARLAAAAQLPPSPPPSRPRRTVEVLLAGALAVIVAAAVAVPVVLIHRSHPATPLVPKLAEPLIVFGTCLQTPSPHYEVEDMPLSGGSLRPVASLGPCGGGHQTFLAGQFAVEGSTDGLAVADIATGATSLITVPGVPMNTTEIFPAPGSQPLVAIPIYPASGAQYPDSIVEVDVSSGAVVRRITLTGAVISELGQAQVTDNGAYYFDLTAWLNDGIHASGVCPTPGTGTASCGYLVDPTTGGVTPLPSEDDLMPSTSEHVNGGVIVSPDGKREAVVNIQGGFAVGPVGGPYPATNTYSNTYFGVEGETGTPQVLALGDNGIVLMSVPISGCTSCAVGAASVTYLFGATAVAGPDTSSPYGPEAAALPAGGFILVTADANFTQTVWRISAVGTATAIATVLAQQTPGFTIPRFAGIVS